MGIWGLQHRRQETQACPRRPGQPHGRCCRACGRVTVEKSRSLSPQLAPLVKVVGAEPQGCHQTLRQRQRRASATAAGATGIVHGSRGVRGGSPRCRKPGAAQSRRRARGTAMNRQSQARQHRAPGSEMIRHAAGGGGAMGTPPPSPRSQCALRAAARGRALGRWAWRCWRGPRRGARAAAGGCRPQRRRRRGPSATGPPLRRTRRGR